MNDEVMHAQMAMVPPVTSGKHVLVLAARTRSLVNFRGQLLQAMIENGHLVTTCAAEPHSVSESELERLGIGHVRTEIQRAGLNPLRDIRTLARLYGLMTRLRPQVFLGYTIKPVIYGSLAARWAGVEERYALITGLGYAFGEGGMRGRVLSQAAVELYRRSLAGSKAVFFQNPDDLALFRQHRIVTGRQAVLVNGSGVDLAHFAPAPPPAGPPVFLLIARLIAEKGVLEYVAAARELKKQFPRAVFRLAGAVDSNPKAISRELLDDWQSEGLIEYLGLLEDVRPALANCSVYVLPSYYREGTPRSVLEALATGRPVITTDTPGCRETVVHGVNGFLVPARAVGPLRAAMQRFLEEPDLIAAMGRSSLELARSKYDVHSVNAQMLEVMGLRQSRTGGPVPGGNAATGNGLGSSTRRGRW